MPGYENLERDAIKVLRLNDLQTHTIPSKGLYSDDAWLWDSAFSAIGWSHINPRRGAVEIDTIFDGQWQNGMIPNMRIHRSDPVLWACRRLNQNAPRSVTTSGITQPPIMAEAVQRVSQKMDNDDRRPFTVNAIGRLAAYHEWIYNERNPGKSGLFAAVHPWETGMENTPSWIRHMETIDWGVTGRIIHALNPLIQLGRNDTKHAPKEQRSNSIESKLYAQSFIKLRSTHYDPARLADDYPLHIEDVHMNSILIRNNEILDELADEYDVPLSDTLRGHMAQTRTNLDTCLWDDTDQMYYPRDAVSGKLIKISTIASLMPIYAGSAPIERVDALIGHMTDPESFGLPYGIPTVPYNSPYYRKHCYWTAPTWLNINWALQDGLDRQEHALAAQSLRTMTLDMAEIGGMHEYFDAETAQGLGAKNFSWTAALTLDLIINQRDEH